MWVQPVMGAGKYLSERVPCGKDSAAPSGERVHVEWDPHAAVTPLGQLPFFIEFLKVSGLLDAWVADCPLEYKSNNASFLPESGIAIPEMLLTAARNWEEEGAPVFYCAWDNTAKAALRFGG
jgi:hypothetical protein